MNKWIKQLVEIFLVDWILEFMEHPVAITDKVLIDDFTSMSEFFSSKNNRWQKNIYIQKGLSGFTFGSKEKI